MAGKGNNKQAAALVQDLDKQIQKLEEALKSLKESVDAIQVGDGKFPYWNGGNAYSIIKNALSQYDTDMVLLDYIKSCQGSIKNY
jgi:ABC-type enterochelin transport system substrate-binding protein